MVRYYETRKRSLIKAIGYRIIVSLIAWIVALFFTGSVEKATWMMIMYYIGAGVIYYVWDRIWVKYIRYGLEIVDGNGHDNERDHDQD